VSRRSLCAKLLGRAFVGGSVFALACGFASPASLAQSPGGKVSNSSEPKVEQAAPVPGLGAEGLRREEVKVRLAWLADPVTFPYFLSASAADAEVHLTGYVPTEAIQRRAADLAGKATTLRVVDELRVQPNMALHFATPRPLDVLWNEAVELLRKELGERAEQITVTAGADGRVSLSGVFVSVEEQLSICESLRRLPACACVVGRLAGSGADGGATEQPSPPTAAKPSTAPAPRWVPASSPMPEKLPAPPVKAEGSPPAPPQELLAPPPPVPDTPR
jgi:hypothetical protein